MYSTHDGRTILSAALAALALSALCAPSLAFAQKTKVAVSEVEGKGGAQVRGAVMKALQERDEIKLVSASAVSSAEDRLGVRATGNGRYDVSRELGVAAWVEGNVEKSGRTYSATLVIIDGGNGQTLTVMSYEGKQPKQLARLVREGFWQDVGSIIMSAHAPAGSKREREPVSEPVAEEEEEEEEPKRAAREEEEEEEEPKEEEEEEEQEAEAEPESEPSEGDDSDLPSPLDVSAGVVALARDFAYNDNLSGLYKYHLDLGPALALRANWYPVAHFEDSALAHIGLDLRARLLVLVDSGLDDESYPTSSSMISAGLRGRLPLGDHELAAVVGYISQTYEIGAAKVDGGELESGIPAASYGMLRLGIEARFAISDFRIGFAAAFLPVMSTGELEDWFPHSSAKALEAELGIGYALSKSFELTGSFGLQRVAFAMNPKVDDIGDGLPIAGGAVDQLWLGTLGAKLIL